MLNKRYIILIRHQYSKFLKKCVLILFFSDRELTDGDERKTYRNERNGSPSSK